MNPPKIKNYKQLLGKIKTLIFDVDGVLTNGFFQIASDGEQLRTMYVKDGYALQLAVKKGYRVAILSGGRSNVLTERFKYLGVTDVFLAVNNKMDCFSKYVQDNNLDKSEILYMGDDIPDYKVMSNVSVPCCPADAAEEIKSLSLYISPYDGGRGCVRDIIEQVMKVHGKWFDDEAHHW